MVAATAAAVSNAVAGAVAGAVAASTGAAVGGAAAGGAAGGGAGGAGGGAGGAASGGMIAPLIFGAQRFGASGGLSVEKSDLQDGVAGGLGWADGELQITSSEGSRRRMLRYLQSTYGDDADEVEVEEGPTSTAVAKLYNQILTALLAVLVVFALQACAVRHWRHRANKRYYAYHSQAAVKRRFIRQLTNNGKFQEPEDINPPVFSPFVRTHKLASKVSRTPSTR